MDVALAQILLVLLVSITDVQSQITKGPVNSLKKVGDSVTLECVTRSSNCDQVGWSKMEGAQSPRTVFRDGTILNGFRDGRYNVSNIGGCNLTITQLNISDSGRFSCVLTVGASEEARGSVLVVIDVREECQSIGTSTELSQYDSYSFSTAINVPPKSVEPSNVTLSFQDKAHGETETTDDQHPPTTVKTTLTGIARKVNITQHVCRASFPPSTADGFDSSTATCTLDVCTTHQLTVSYPVEKISFSPSSGPYYKETTVRCIANGYPYPTFEWTHLKSGAVVYGDTLVIAGDADDKYTCTATNTVTGTARSVNEAIVVGAACESGGCPQCPGFAAGIVILVIIILVVVIVFAAFVCDWCPGCPLFVWLDSIKKKKKKKVTDKKHENEKAEALLADRMSPLSRQSLRE